MGTPRVFVDVVLFIIVVAVVVAAGGSRPVALRDIQLVFAAPPDVACLQNARGLPLSDRFFAPIIGAVRAGITLVVAPPVTSALATALLATTLLAALLPLLPAR